MTNPLFESNDVKNFDQHFQFRNETESEARNNVSFTEDSNPIDFDKETKKSDKMMSQQVKEQLDR